MAFQFELDHSSLPKLASKGDNYSEWKSSWIIAYKYAKLWDNVNGRKARPETPGDAQEQWDDVDNKAMVMILSSVHPDWTLTVTAHETAAAAWTALAARFDRDIGKSSIYLFRNITSLRFRDGDDLRQHVDNFHQLWIKMQKRCQSSTQEVARAMRPIFNSDQVKGSFFLTTLPDTMDNVIDNLNTRGLSRFTEIEPKMLDIADKHTHEETQAAYHNPHL